MRTNPLFTALTLSASLASCTATPSIAPFAAFGESGDVANWVHLDGRPAEWISLGDGAVEVKPGSGNIITKALFGDALIELDFMTPHMPDAQGQARGNSGVYMQGLYEVQILDSFGIEPGLDTCGAIYNVSVASQSVCLPPGEWQHYAIEFTAPDFDSDGLVLSNARLTVWQNGVMIQDDQEVSGPTGSARDGNAVEYGPLMLQDHGNTVRYRDVQITPRF
jgi:hypothetical protein